MVDVMGNLVLVKAVDEENMSPGGIIIPEVAQRESMRGEVIAIGKGTLVQGIIKDEETGEYKLGYKLRPIDEAIKPGVIVFFPRWAGHEIEMDSEKLLFIREHDIVAYLDKDVSNEDDTTE